MQNGQGWPRSGARNQLEREEAAGAGHGSLVQRTEPYSPSPSSATSAVLIWKMGTVTLTCSSYLRGLCIGWQLWGELYPKDIFPPHTQLSPPVS